jgi:hypothetical protein
VSCNERQDSQRLGALMRGHDSPEEKILLGLIMKDLAVLHDKSFRELEQQYVDHYAWDWYVDNGALGEHPKRECTNPNYR